MNTAQETDYYAILELPQSSSVSEIRTAYKRLALLRHPDKNPDDPSATAAFQILGDAYSILTVETTRRAYDLRYNRIKKNPPNNAADILQRARKAAEEAKSKAEAAREEEARRQQERENEDPEVAVRREEREQKQERWDSAEKKYDNEIRGHKETIRLLEGILENCVLIGDLHQSMYKVREGMLAKCRTDLQHALDMKEATWKDIWVMSDGSYDLDALKKRQETERVREEEERRERVEREQAQRGAAAEREAREEAVRRALQEQEAAERVMEERARVEKVERARVKIQRERDQRDAKASANKKDKVEKEQIVAREREAEKKKQKEQEVGSADARSDCMHKTWAKVEGQHCCSGCNMFLGKWILQCSECGLKACAKCKHIAGF